MREWTEQEEQEMIELAKQGDPRANYELSLWALRRGEEEPGETRWNRLAAKCLVKAAQAGYPPAQDRMAELLHQSQGAKAAQPAPEPGPGPEPAQPVHREPVRLSDARAAAARRGQSPAPESTARRPARIVPGPLDEEEEPEDYGDEDDYPRRRRVKQRRPPEDDRYDRDDGGQDAAPAGGPGAGWGERQWRRVEIICVAVCAVLLVAIAVMIITSRSGSAGQTGAAIPAAGAANLTGDADSAGTTGDDAGGAGDDASAQEEYPSAETIADIQAADLEMFPAESEYVNVPTTATVKVDSQSLRLRKGPSTTYTPPICSMEDGTVVSIFANKENWSLVLYEGGEEGPVYGWCSSEYLIVTAGAADDSSVG